MTQKALIEFAYDAANSIDHSFTFKELFDKTIELSSLELTQSEIMSKMASLYTQISTDGRFALLEDGKWDLRSRHSYDQVKVDLDMYTNEDESDDQEEQELLNAELGEDEDDEKEDLGDDDLDFDKPKKENDDEEF